MAKDGFELAREFDAVATAIKERLFGSWDQLTPKQRDDLDEAFWDMTTMAMSLRTKSVTVLLARAALSVEQLSEQTDRAREALKTLNDIRKAIKVATAVLGLVGAVSVAAGTGNIASVGPVLQALKELLDEIQA
jgi:hypothetical protein